MNVDAIFGAFDRFSELTGLVDQQQRKQAQIQAVNSRRCGNCDHWMKTTCVPEKQHGQFKSNGSLACGAFTLSDGSKRLNEKFTVELAEISSKLAAFKARHLPTT
jgi:hypothetical protein